MVYENLKQYLTGDEYLALCARPPRWITYAEHEAYALWCTRMDMMFYDLTQFLATHELDTATPEDRALFKTLINDSLDHYYSQRCWWKNYMVHSPHNHDWTKTLKRCYKKRARKK